ncbi:LysR family transcriptional regulator [Glycomyces algeriensis]|uniref:LysR family transcriptional regulator n=1 Tax=Glycomyces algeriensis TaxID=256037 RepID=A0A9W6G4I7_9ACTN|nr:LysR family transcriptional regulator [Glycomyces algeriensis]
MERQEIETVLVLGEELHFRRAAERLHVAPARVTQLIQKLEREIGAPLFNRSNRAVTPTDIGRLLLSELAPAHAAVTAAFLRAAEAAKQPAGVLRLGFLGPATGEHLADLADAFDRNHRDAEAQVVLEVEVSDPLSALRSGRVDILALYAPVVDPGFVTGPVVLQEKMVLAVPASHHLAGRGSATMEDLPGEPVITANASRDWLRQILPDASPSGRPIVPVSWIDSIQAKLALVGAGKGIGVIGQQWARFNPRPQIVYLPLDDSIVHNVSLVWRADRETELIRNFSRLAHDFGPVQEPSLAG